jgi:hypothetical protein
MASPLQIAFDSFKAKDKAYSEVFAYYDGDQPLKYTTDRLARAFDNFQTYFAQNWCAVVVDAVTDRLVLKGLTAKGDAGTKLEELFKKLHLELDATDVHEAAEVAGEAFIVVDVVDGEVDVYYNDPRQVMVQYNTQRPKIKDFAAKRFDDDEGLPHIVIYFEDRIEEYVGSKNGSTARSYGLVDTKENTMPAIPVFHFRPSRRKNKSSLDKATLSVQDAINKLFSDMMVSAEFDAFKMRVIISQEDPGDVLISPDMKLWLPAKEGKDGQETSIQELGGGTLENFYKPMGELAASLSATTKTPKHYFFNVGQVPSGEALITMESPLVKKVMQRQENYAVTWAELGAFLLEIEGVSVVEGDITPTWGHVETIQPLTQAQIMQTEKSAGVPLKVSAQRLGWGEDEIDMLPEDIDENPEVEDATS